MLKRQKDQPRQRPWVYFGKPNKWREATEDGADQTVQELTGLVKESELYSIGTEEPLMV